MPLRLSSGETAGNGGDCGKLRKQASSKGGSSRQVGEGGDMGLG